MQGDTFLGHHAARTAHNAVIKACKSVYGKTNSLSSTEPFICTKGTQSIMVAPVSGQGK